MKHSFVAILFLIFLNGCVIFPAAREVRQGQILSSDSLAFLNGKNIGRDEVISTFGPPLFESKESRVFIYLSETSIRWTVVGMEPVLFPEDSNEAIVYKPAKANANSNERLQALLVAFDGRDLVRSHALKDIKQGSLEQHQLEDLCQQYARQIAKPHP